MGLLSGGRPLTRRRGERAGRKRTHARTERRGAEVNASRSPKFLGQPVVRATRSTELVDPRRWVVVVVVAPVTSIPTEALQSKRPMPKTHVTRELSLSRISSSSRYSPTGFFLRADNSTFGWIPINRYARFCLFLAKIRERDRPRELEGKI